MITALQLASPQPRGYPAVLADLGAEELAALHKRTCRIPSVLATYTYHTIQYFVTSIDAGMPMHVASTCFVTIPGRRSHVRTQSDVLLLRSIIQSADDTSMCLSPSCVCLS